MSRLILLITALAGMALMGAPAYARSCSVQTYDHNGSTMQAQLCDRDLTISYSAPRSGMAKVGVTPGTVLFQGRVSRTGGVTGDALLFSATCGEIAYSVQGTMTYTSIVLSGQAPKRNPSCRVTSYRNDNLLFTLVNQVAQPVADDWYAIAGSFRKQSDAQRVVNTLNGQSNDWFVLNTRECPNFTNGYWIATIGPLSKANADAWRQWTGQSDAYIKTCN